MTASGRLHQPPRWHQVLQPQGLKAVQRPLGRFPGASWGCGCTHETANDMARHTKRMRLSGGAGWLMLPRQR